MSKTYQKSGGVFFVVVFLWATKKWLKKDAPSLFHQLHLANVKINFYYANVGWDENNILQNFLTDRSLRYHLKQALVALKNKVSQGVVRQKIS